MLDHHLSDTKIAIGDLENAIAISSSILLTKKIIDNSMKKEQQPHILSVKNDVKDFYFQEKYRYYIRSRKRFLIRHISLSLVCMTKSDNTTYWYHILCIYCTITLLTFFCTNNPTYLPFTA